MRPTFGLITVLVMSPALVAGERIDFVRDVQPILAAACYDCHGESEQSGGLRIDSKRSTLRGGDFYGPSIIPGKPDESPLFQFVSGDQADLQMPPEGDSLNPEQVKVLRHWIEQGAVWPDGDDAVEEVNPLDHWSFRPLQQPSTPDISDEAWATSMLDRFVFARLQEKGLQPNPPASRIDWLRRVTYDLTGLPPTLDEVRDFIGDERSDAKERVVDRLLASPRYGERWAQHWLDVVRYADTHGFEVNTERPNAWPYRDYVIEALNDDTPYDQFIREQIIGDRMNADAATGFLITASVLLPGQIGADEPSKRLARQDSLDEIVVNLGQTFLGLTIGCARCHSHKFDPITQRDYYAMQSFVAGVLYEDRPLQTPEAVAQRQQVLQWKQRLTELDVALTQFVPLALPSDERPRRLPVNAKHNTDRFAPVRTQRLRFIVLKTNNLEPCIDELEVINEAEVNVALASHGATVTSSGDTHVPDRHELRLINDGIYGNSSSWMSNEMGAGWVIVQFAEPQTIDRVNWGRDRQEQYQDRLAIHYQIEVETAPNEWQVVASHADRFPADTAATAISDLAGEGLTPQEISSRQRLLDEQYAIREQLKNVGGDPMVFAGQFREPDKIHVLRRGDPEQPIEPVTPAVPEVLGNLRLDENAPEGERRAALAEWIANPANPLTARVMVNRIWQGHFGVGIVETANDFGRNGSPPTHPQLLDWLASDFIKTGWSLKSLHRQIVLSSTYGQSSLPRADGLEVDADTRWLWRYPARRLSGEAIRDAVLLTSGTINFSVGGPGYSLFNQRGGLSGFVPIEQFDATGHKRMIYAHRVRRERDAVFGAFDCPDAGQSTPRRRESTTPIQALNLLNSQFVIDHAEAFASQLKETFPDSCRDQVNAAYLNALGRVPSSHETDAACHVAEIHGLDAVCRALLNCNEFLYIP